MVVPGKVFNVRFAQASKVKMLIPPDTRDERTFLFEPVVLVDKRERPGLGFESVVEGSRRRGEAEESEEGKEGQDRDEHRKMSKRGEEGRK